MLIVATGALERPFPVPMDPAGRVRRGRTGPVEGKRARAGRPRCDRGDRPPGLSDRFAVARSGCARHRDSSDTTPPGNYVAAALRIAGTFGRTDYLFKGIELVREVRSRAARVLTVCPPSRGARRAAGRGRALDARPADRRSCRSMRSCCIRAWCPIRSSRERSAWPITGARNSCAGSPCSTRGCAAPAATSSSPAIPQAYWEPEAAEETGTLAALQAATSLGRLSESARDTQAKAPRARLQRLARVVTFLDRAHRPAEHSDSARARSFAGAKIYGRGGVARDRRRLP